MDHVLLHEAMKLNKERKRKKRWQQVVSIMASVVVFCTTYALILPAITMEKDPVCGQEAHEHEEACFEVRTASEIACAFQSHQHTDACRDAMQNLICGYGDVIIHTHNELCTDAEGNVLCSLPQISEHIHGTDCYAPTSELACTLEEIQGHAHSESCYQTTTVYTCGLEETEAHAHSEACFAPAQVLSCTVQEAQPHTHSESCYVVENEVACGLEEAPPHTHGEACFTTQTQIGCGLAEAAPHTHAEGCYQGENELICTLAETEGHAHSEGCNVQTRILSCTLAETEGHAHSESCIRPVQKLACGLAETEGHTHAEACYTTENQLVCTLAETAGHTHAEACGQIQNELICTVEETEGHVHSENCYITTDTLVCALSQIAVHTHTEACFGEDGSLICQIIPAVVHDHTEDCIAALEPEKVLICEKEIHVHSDDCYPDEAEEEAGFICGMGIHVHTAACTNEAGELTCTIPEHPKHTAACLVEDFDETADLESQEVWEATLEDVKLTGNWPTDVLTIADSQLGYTESTRNMYLDEAGKLTGYTRYGAWYGSPYGDWCAMFTSFCMHYAGVENVPLGAGCTTWIGELTEAGLYRTADSYTPKPGDLIFFDWEYYEGAPLDSDHVGFVAEVIPATEETPAQIITIEGNSSEQVEYNTYDLPDTTIIGYAEMPVGNTIILSHQGEDFIVTTTFGVDAGIPATAQLQVVEILPGTEEYDSYYSQAIESMVGQGTLESLDDVDVSFARFFDIHFLADGQSIEPTSSVDIRITYNDSLTKAEDESGVAVHFADEGIEILDAQTSQEGEEPGQVDTFEFTQNSFSVTGIMLLATDDTIATAKRVNFSDLDGTGNKRYIVYAYLDGIGYFAFQCVDSNGSVAAVPVTVNSDGIVTWTANASNAGMFWTFTKQANANEYRILNEGYTRYMHATGSNLTTSGNWTSYLVPSAGTGANVTFKVRSNSLYARLYSPSWGQIAYEVTNNANQAANYYIAEVAPGNCHIWFDGTHGGIMSLYGSDNTVQSAAYGETITLPTEWKSPSKYDYKVAGWYDIHSNTYYKAGAEYTVIGNAVLYPDWVAATYDVGIKDEHTVDSLDTNSFIKTYVFDYNSLFNMQSLDLSSSSVSATSHSETWTLTQRGLVDYGNANTLDFIFIDWDGSGKVSMPSNVNGSNAKNYNHSYITQGIIQETSTISGGKNLMDLLFDPNTEVIGKHYIGEGNYLYQYMDSTTPNFDGIESHDGYYYFHSRLNAASYNQTEQRFYLYDYLERTSDSEKDKGDGEYSDFLPFNSIYANHKNMDIEEYTDPNSGKNGYMFDAKADGQHSEYENAGTNYWFGFRSDIEFYLPNDSGTQDAYGNYGNISTRGKHMVFEFHGDDDVWVYVDGQLMLDLGGVHGIEYGKIDFSTGTVSYNVGESNTPVTRTFEQILGAGKNITEGTHTMQFYYMERGGSQSNASIYFNIAPRYDLEIRKEDEATAEVLNGTVFGIYSDEACTVPAELWDSAMQHELDMVDGVVNDATNLFTVTDGYAKAWGVSAGKTYYIREEQPPEGYPSTDDLIRITLNNRGTATIETTTLHGADGKITLGFEVIESNVNNTLKIVSLTVTNQKEDRTTDYRVQKDWHQDATNIPAYIEVFLTQDGVRFGRTAVLNEGNGWTYTWKGLPEYHPDGVTKYVYAAEEILVPGYSTSYSAPHEVVDHVDWLEYPKMEDSITYVLTHGGKALSWNGAAFEWIEIDVAESDAGKTAQWTVTTNLEGFRLTNGNGYSITYNPATNRFIAVQSTDVVNNQVLYFSSGRMMAQQDDVYHYFGNLGASESTFSNGLVFEMFRKEVMTGTLLNILNTPVREDEQTHIEVNKAWGDGEDHSGDEVVIKLLIQDLHTLEFRDTGRTVTLNAANNWQGSFEDLPYYDAYFTGRPAVYKLEEVQYGNYLPEYSAGTTVPGRSFETWENTTVLTAGDILRFVNAAQALADNGYGLVLIRPNNLSDAKQQWEVVNSYGSIYLKNVSTGRYLRTTSTGASTVTTLNEASKVSLTNGSLLIGSYYLDLSSGEVHVTTVSNNGTVFSVSRHREAQQMPGTAYTVTNNHAVYNLPETGAAGTHSFYRYGLLLILAAAMIYICKPQNEQRRRAYRK